MTIFETIERARKHYQQLSPHIKERETAKHLHALLLIVDSSMSRFHKAALQFDGDKKAEDSIGR